MNLKKILAIASAVLMMFSAGTVHAGKFDEIDKNITIARLQYAEASEKLERAAGMLFYVFTQDKDPSVAHAAELKIRERCPKEYGEYLEARGNLEYMLELKYVATMNSTKGEEK